MPVDDALRWITGPKQHVVCHLGQTEMRMANGAQMTYDVLFGPWYVIFSLLYIYLTNFFIQFKYYNNKLGMMPMDNAQRWGRQMMGNGAPVRAAYDGE